MKFKSFAFTVFSICVATVCGTEAARAASLSVVADLLNNPRNFDWDSQGNIYLAESGSGGDGNGGVNCIPSPSAGYIPLCSGNTGSVVKIAPEGTKTTVLSNLPSIALSPSGEQGAGPADFKFDSKGNAYVLYGLAGDPNLRDQVLQSPALGQLYKLDLNTGSLTSLADFAKYEATFNPDGSDVINNPYGFTIKDDKAYVVDGGSNVIYRVGLDGSGIEQVAALPTKQLDQSSLVYPTLPDGLTEEALQFNPNAQSVPTGIAVAPDGSLTVAEYTAFPYPEGKARIYSVNPDDLSSIQTIADGFTQLTGVTYDSEGNLYALQHINQSEWKAIEQGGNIIGDISGSIIKIAKDGTRETIISGNGLEAASGLFFGPDGNLYTSNRARLAPGERGGQLVKIDIKSGATKVPEPASVMGLLLATAAGAKVMKRKRQEELLAKVETL
ncbi:ScyD/ScyE family protein [Brasilonema sp. UFV-L1]|uniref:ScyD/ScyE family protein n=1 Tax=Brasilonema sp. UFV-L1 TaxID=2234130 RepID=UPI00145D31AA|nr:ScyD/ScyE family protein [Brasilonema sp. UFV-L1]NMG10077.1 ScyD/ScyE family protein [Brasilonema sp. UFV-L1]